MDDNTGREVIRRSFNNLQDNLDNPNVLMCIVEPWKEGYNYKREIS